MTKGLRGHTESIVGCERASGTVEGECVAVKCVKEGGMAKKRMWQSVEMGWHTVRNRCKERQVKSAESCIGAGEAAGHMSYVVPPEMAGKVIGHAKDMVYGTFTQNIVRQLGSVAC